LSHINLTSLIPASNNNPSSFKMSAPIEAKPSTNPVPNGSKTPDSSSTIPIIDFSTFKPESSLEERKAVANDLAAACRRVGFVYIINHGLSPSLLAEAFAWTKKLYALGHEEKMQAPHPEGYAVHRGYSHPGLEKVSNAMSTGEGDEDTKKKLREVVDCKVCQFHQISRHAY
jgi:hypothetical protein